ncbi:hypothetical protein CTAM01_09943 [Colletotrichum tamarilloi]|uniref:Uncharacterized protein n=1 Tax=Colletotrichum tamarilloi TaxID=1209934 RepID=A0ABQ9R2E7_9PEZI|nr:uncharacterized protein CTAM01_09943 [Colletotrichum tamarilloi]KAK1492526.1 hypothetical protein CTAM01_09943 [Colletotrichum tamarilloi]
MIWLVRIHPPVRFGGTELASAVALAGTAELHVWNLFSPSPSAYEQVPVTPYQLRYLHLTSTSTATTDRHHFSPHAVPYCYVYQYYPRTLACLLSSYLPALISTSSSITAAHSQPNSIPRRLGKHQNDCTLQDKPAYSEPLPVANMASEHNPFRRKSASTSLSISTPQPVSTSAFLESITSGISRQNGPPPPEARPAKPKVVKKVRVLSPPPSSPSSPESVHSRGFGRQNDSSDEDSHDEDDQFSKRFPELPGGLPEAAPLRIANASNTPDNPFGKTLQDLEGLTDVKPSSGGSTKAMDVNAFKMLLLTGQAGAGTPPPQTSVSQGDKAPGASHAAPEPEIPRTSQDMADRGVDDQRSLLAHSPSVKKKPPPPSSRHGRKISVQTSGRPHISSETASPISPSDVNKPLPPAPSSHGGDDTEDVFAREAAGKVPEQDSPTPSSIPTPALPATGKRPTPAPPPRRGHARSQSLTANAGVNAPSVPSYEADTPPRSSLESQRSRSESFRSINAPAPPPPRRPHASHRQSFQLASPSSGSFYGASPAPSDIDTSIHATEHTPPKTSPPPPPPARNTSIRRPPSVRSIEAPSRKISGGKENAPPPPPPPPRQRGSSRGSMDGYGMRRTSIDSTRAMGSNVPEEPTAEDDAQQEYDAAKSGKGADILADLDALQREVDALRAAQGK